MRLRGALVAMAFGFAGMLVVSASAQEKKPADKPPAAKPADKPADKPAAAPAAKPAEKPAAAPAAKPADKPADKGAAAPQMGGDDMKKMMEMSAPGKEHEALKPLEGTFTCAVKMTMMPGQPPQESTGTITRKWILGGRYLQEEYKGEIMPKMPFEGIGITGYDKLQKKYHAYWIDTMGTGTFTQTGTIDASGKKFTFTGDNFDPMEMKMKKTKSDMEIVDANKQVMKMYDNGPDGKEFVNFEMTCTKK